MPDFLVLDKNRNKKVDGGNELFGDRNGFKNGFGNLSSYDLNKDGVIDRKDAIYSQLLLWNDINGDGISSSDELFSLSKMGVESIDLGYIMETKKFGPRA